MSRLIRMHCHWRQSSMPFATGEPNWHSCSWQSTCCKIICWVKKCSRKVKAVKTATCKGNGRAKEAPHYDFSTYSSKHLIQKLRPHQLLGHSQRLPPDLQTQRHAPWSSRAEILMKSWVLFCGGGQRFLPGLTWRDRVQRSCFCSACHNGLFTMKLSMHYFVEYYSQRWIHKGSLLHLIFYDSTSADWAGWAIGPQSWQHSVKGDELWDSRDRMSKIKFTSGYAAVPLQPSTG